MPYCFEIDAVILMTKPVAKSSNITPRRSRTKCFRLWSKPDRCFADLLQVSFNGIYRLYIFPKGVETHTRDVTVDSLN